MLITISRDFTADYVSLQAAIDAIPAGQTSPVTLRLRPGMYREKITIPAGAPPILLLGEDRQTTVIAWSDNAHTLGSNGEPLGTFRSGTLTVRSSSFTAENVTIVNDSGPGTGQAVAAMVDARDAVFRRVRLLGDQDTLYAGQGRQYYEDCYIEGDVDYIFGGATAVFERCQLHNKRSRGYITAASTPQDTAFGFVFLNCTITSAPGVADVYLGRPWRDYAHVAFIRTTMDESITPEGWHNWGEPDRESTSRFEEYGSTGAGAAAAGLVKSQPGGTSKLASGAELTESLDNESCGLVDSAEMKGHARNGPSLLGDASGLKGDQEVAASNPADDAATSSSIEPSVSTADSERNSDKTVRRAPWSRQLTGEDVAAYRVIHILGGWHPEGY
ncbi:pectinesterase family protein [Paenibacillus daejeonensis]|uniref:pectinesterase family protein n=1 Tax=Paenibacillus daejeonensis TaxID=135193 RepID=UPI00036F20E7|nr:pectinesterase family protein [Paenibacillus daejeonensis]